MTHDEQNADGCHNDHCEPVDVQQQPAHILANGIVRPKLDSKLQ